VRSILCLHGVGQSARWLDDHLMNVARACGPDVRFHFTESPTIKRDKGWWRPKESASGVEYQVC